jgi:hypothetical protein
MQHPLSAKVGTNFADKRRSLGRYSFFCFVAYCNTKRDLCFLMLREEFREQNDCAVWFIRIQPRFRTSTFNVLHRAGRQILHLKRSLQTAGHNSKKVPSHIDEAPSSSLETTYEGQEMSFRQALQQSLRNQVEISSFVTLTSSTLMSSHTCYRAIRRGRCFKPSPTNKTHESSIITSLHFILHYISHSFQNTHKTRHAETKIPCSFVAYCVKSHWWNLLPLDSSLLWSREIS